jgi:hypothetical protein
LSWALVWLGGAPRPQPWRPLRTSCEGGSRPECWEGVARLAVRPPVKASQGLLVCVQAPAWPIRGMRLFQRCPGRPRRGGASPPPSTYYKQRSQEAGICGGSPAAQSPFQPATAAPRSPRLPPHTWHARSAGGPRSAQAQHRPPPFTAKCHRAQVHQRCFTSYDISRTLFLFLVTHSPVLLPPQGHIHAASKTGAIGGSTYIFFFYF